MLGVMVEIVKVVVTTVVGVVAIAVTPGRVCSEVVEFSVVSEFSV